jgi:multidrug efflux pump subunit AcrA (membrane-fusion protein)
MGWIWRHKLWVGLVLVMLVVVGYTVYAQNRPQEVKVATVSAGDLTLRIAASGIVEAVSDDLAFEAQGVIAEVYVQEGQRVAANEALARLESSRDPFTGRPSVNAGVITAPYPGTVVEVYHRDGALAAMGTPILRIVKDDSRWVTAFINSDDAVQMRPGMHLVCRAGGYLSPGWDLAVVKVGKEAVPRRDTPGSSRQVRVRCEPTQEGFPLVAGTEVDVDGEVPLVENVLLVPAGAVRHDGDRDLVWVVEAGQVSKREVILGPNNFEKVHIREGLAAGDKVVVEGLEDLSEGQRVEMVAYTEPSGEAVGE